MHHLTTWDMCVHVCDLLLTFSLTRIHWKVLAYTSPTYLPDIYLIDNLYIVYDWLLFCHSCHFSWTCSYTDCCWITLVQAGGSAGWEIRVKGDLTPRPDNGKINSSPTTTMSPVVRLRRDATHTITIPGKELHYMIQQSLNLHFSHNGPFILSTGYMEYIYIYIYIQMVCQMIMYVSLSLYICMQVSLVTM